MYSMNVSSFRISSIPVRHPADIIVFHCLISYLVYPALTLAISYSFMYRLLYVILEIIISFILNTIHA
jgi:hypothetical protein